MLINLWGITHSSSVWLIAIFIIGACSAPDEQGGNEVQRSSEPIICQQVRALKAEVGDSTSLRAKRGRLIPTAGPISGEVYTSDYSLAGTQQCYIYDNGFTGIFCALEIAEQEQYENYLDRLHVVESQLDGCFRDEPSFYVFDNRKGWYDYHLLNRKFNSYRTGTASAAVDFHLLDGEYDIFVVPSRTYYRGRVRSVLYDLFGDQLLFGIKFEP